MSRFTEFLEMGSSKKIEIHNTGLFRRLIDWGQIKIIKLKKGPHVSTNDLDQDRKMKVDYLESRKRRKKEEGKGANPSIYEIWKI